MPKIDQRINIKDSQNVTIIQAGGNTIPPPKRTMVEDRSVHLGKGAKVGGDIVTGTKIVQPVVGKEKKKPVSELLEKLAEESEKRLKESLE